MRKYPQFYRNSLFAILVSFTFSACTPDEEKIATTAPFDLPPQEAFLLDFSALESASSKAITHSLSYYDYSGAPIGKVIQDYSDSQPGYAALNSISNFNFSAFRVGAWNLISVAVMAIPTASFLEAFNHQPTATADGKWQWSYSVTVLLQRYDARLVGAIVGDQVVWEMYLSRGDGAFTDVNWYSGTHNLTATSGSWTLRQRDNTTEVVSDIIQIDWERDLTAGTRRIRYTNLSDNGYIENGISADASYDAYFNIDNKVLPALINIEWNSTDKNGRVKSSNITDPGHFGHIDWNCWDSATAVTPYADAICP